MFGKVLIFALSLAYLAVLVHSEECECKPPPCDEKNEKKVEAYLNKVNEKCKDKNDEDYKKCMGSVVIALMGSEILKAIQARDCKPGEMEKMPEGEDKTCCEQTFKYFEDCQDKAVVNGATPLRKLD